MATRERNKASVSNVPNVGSDVIPIDIIDLTVDSVANTALRRTKRRTENLPYSQPETCLLPSHIRRRRRCCTTGSQEHIQEQSTEIVDENNSNVSQICSMEPTEVINLDDSESNIFPCVNDSGQSRILTCPICYEELSNKRIPTSTRCGHIYCGKCLEKAVKATKTCPLCKRHVILRSCTRLHF